MMIGSHFCFIERWQAFGMRNHLFQSSMWQRQRAFPNNVSQAVRPHYFDFWIRPPCPILYTDPFYTSFYFLATAAQINDFLIYQTWLLEFCHTSWFKRSKLRFPCSISPNQLKTGDWELGSTTQFYFLVEFPDFLNSSRFRKCWSAEGAYEKEQNSNAFSARLPDQRKNSLLQLLFTELKWTPDGVCVLCP